MKIKFNKFERIAGLFVFTALLGALMVTISVAVKKGWFSSKVSYSVILNSAEGLYAGTPVQISGLRAGSVDEVELLAADRVKVTFEILEKFEENVRTDSVLKVVRPFIIGEKVLDISVGSGAAGKLAAGSELAYVESFDMLELLSGRKLGNVLGSLEQVTSNMRILLEAFADPRRTQSMVEMFDRLNPLLSNLNAMVTGVNRITKVVNKDDRAEQMIVSLVSITHELDKVLPLLNAQAPDLGIQLGQVVSNLNLLTDEFKKLTPAISAIAPRLPETSIRAVEALDETVVLLKALQKSFLLRGNVEEVRESEKQRLPASQ